MKRCFHSILIISKFFLFSSIFLLFFSVNASATLPQYTPLHLYWNANIGDNYYTTTYQGGEFSGYLYIGIASLIEITNTESNIPLYQYWNEDIKNHLYTTDVLDEGADGYYSQGIIGYVQVSPSATDIPLYEYVNSTIGDNYLTTTWKYIYFSGKFEGRYNYRRILCYVKATTTPNLSRKELHEYYSEEKTDHYYTITDHGETFLDYNYVGVVGMVEEAPSGFNTRLWEYWCGETGKKDHLYSVNTVENSYYKQNSGVLSGFVETSKNKDNIPLYEYWDPSLADHYYTTTHRGESFDGYQYVGIACYIWGNIE